MTWLLSESGRTTITLAALAILVCVAVSALCLIAKHTKNASVNARKLHIQQANIVAMLLRAGFRPARGRPDWCDDAHETRVIGDADTKLDMRSPWRLFDDGG